MNDMTFAQKQVQKKIIDELGSVPEINPGAEIRNRVDFLKKYLLKNELLKSLVLGISGGQDSTLAGKLAQMAVDELNIETSSQKYQFIAIRLPYGVQQDEEDAQSAIQFIKADKVLTVNVKPAVDSSVESLKNAGMNVTDFLKGNEKARERMKVQYAIASMYQGIVIGTDHAAESITGFFTKFGDGACDVAPLSGLNKRQGRKMLEFLGCPEHLYLKVPTADLEEVKPQLADEVALGLGYEDIDDYLEGKAVTLKVAERLQVYYRNTKHKRRLPITPLNEKGAR